MHANWVKNDIDILPLRGERIYLRPITLEDVTERYLNWLNNPETTKGLATSPGAHTMQSLRDFVSRAIQDSGTQMFTIRDTENDLHIGNIKLDRFDQAAGTCELGLLIGDQAYWGRGIGKEACKLAIAFAFDDLKMRKVLLSVYDNNPAAIKLYHGLGFVLEGSLRKHVFEGGQYHDKRFMGLFENEFIR
jgi:[ribosomal protein S5]-alanine N-acetyltransferase